MERTFIVSEAELVSRKQLLADFYAEVLGMATLAELALMEPSQEIQTNALFGLSRTLRRLGEQADLSAEEFDPQNFTTTERIDRILSASGRGWAVVSIDFTKTPPTPALTEYYSIQRFLLSLGVTAALWGDTTVIGPVRREGNHV